MSVFAVALGLRVASAAEGLLTGSAPATEGLVTLDSICGKMPAPNPPLAPGNPAPETRRMAARLTAHYASLKPEATQFLNERLAQWLQSQVAGSTNLSERLGLEFGLAIQQMNSAHPDAALNTLHGLQQELARAGGSVDGDTASEITVRRGLAWLRVGEQENCLAAHNADSCIFPLRPPAYHVLTRGSRAAAGVFQEHLASHPDDLGARWLLNLAHMTLGEYPDRVDPRWLIPPSRFASEYPMPRFVDVSEGLGLDANDLAGGVIVDDFDNDGLYDLVISAWDEKGQLRLFHNNGNGTFTERTSEAGLVGEVASLNIQQTDYNNDGFLDIWMMRGGWLGKQGRMPSSLLRNNGDGTFTDVTEQAGLLRFHPTMASRWFDYDGDGWLDLFIANESTDPKDPDPCELFHNNGDGTFTECAAASGIRVAQFVKAVACADYDHDGRPDLYLSIRGGPNILLHNDGQSAPAGSPLVAWHFTDVTSRSGPIAAPLASFGTFFFDFDNDGWDDLLVFGYHIPNGVADVAADYLGLPHRAARARLYRNRGNGTFEDVTVAAHLDRVLHTMGHNFGDLDNDGWLDFYCATGDPDLKTLIPNRMFRNAEGLFFQDVTTATGTGHLQKGHAVAFADFNDDGCQDIYASIGGAYAGDYARNVLFLNPGSSNAWVKLKLVGVRANRAAIGADVRVTVETPGGLRILHRVVGPGGSFGCNPLRLEVGLGDATAIRLVEIHWPGSDTLQAVRGLEMNRAYEVKEGVDQPRSVALHPVKLKSTGARPVSDARR